MPKLVSTILLATVLGASPLAVSAPTQAAPPPPNQHHQQVAPQRGEKLPDDTKRESVNPDDYQRLGLKTPAKGYRWVKVGNQYVMIAVTTGLITAILGGIANN